MDLEQGKTSLLICGELTGKEGRKKRKPRAASASPKRRQQRLIIYPAEPLLACHEMDSV